MYHVCGSHKYASFRSPRFQLQKMKMTKGLGCCALKSITASAQRSGFAPGQQVHSAGMLV